MIQNKNLALSARINVLGIDSGAALDLSGTSSLSIWPMYFARKTIIDAINVVYVESASTDAGVAVSLGTPGTAAAYGTVTSLTGTSGASKIVQSVTITCATITAGSLLCFNTAGSKTGAGTVTMYMEYHLAD